jgi:plastocyanin
VKAVRDGKPVPNGTVLAMAIFAAQVDANGNPTRDANGRFQKGNPIGVTVMEKRAGWGSSVPAEWRNGDWQYASFMADGKPNEKANAGIKACFECHLPHAQQDFVISLAGLSGTATGAATKPTGPGTVAIAEFLFGPEKITVKQGQMITWTNVDESPHQVTIQGATTLRTPGGAQRSDHGVAVQRCRFLWLHLRPASGHEGSDRSREVVRIRPGPIGALADPYANLIWLARSGRYL